MGLYLACPANDYTCPYIDSDGDCHNDDAEQSCDEYMYYPSDDVDESNYDPYAGCDIYD